MPDIFSKKERSRIMSLIKSRNTNFETSFLSILSAEIYPQGYRYRKHYSKAIGKPDVVFVKQKIAVFLDSDFWHGRDFKNLKPQLRSKFWLKKITRNMRRDKEVNRALRNAGWQVLRFGEKELKRNPRRAVRRIERALRN
jgi:DNA mismatch endonuclease (patch repair protein)